MQSTTLIEEQDDKKKLQFFIKRLNGETIIVETKNDATAADLYAATEAKSGISSFRLINGGRTVARDDNCKLSSLGLCNESTLQLVVKLRTISNSATLSTIGSTSSSTSSFKRSNYIVVPYDIRRENLTQKGTCMLEVYSYIGSAEAERTSRAANNKKRYEEAMSEPTSGVSFVQGIESAKFSPTNIGQWLQINEKTAPAVLEIVNKQGHNTYYLVGNNNGNGGANIALVRSSDAELLNEITLLKRNLELDKKFVVSQDQYKALNKKLKMLYSPGRRELFSVCEIELGYGTQKNARVEYIDNFTRYTAQELDKDSNLIPLDFTKKVLIDYDDNGVITNKYVFDTKAAADSFRSKSTGGSSILGNKDRITFQFSKEFGEFIFKIYGNHAKKLTDDNATDIFALDAVAYGRVMEVDAEEMGFSCVMAKDLTEHAWPVEFIQDLIEKLKKYNIDVDVTSNYDGYCRFSIDLTAKDDSVILCIIYTLQLAYSQYQKDLEEQKISPEARIFAQKNWDDINDKQYQGFKVQLSLMTEKKRGNTTTKSYWNNLSDKEKAKDAQSILFGSSQQASAKAPATPVTTGSTSSEQAMKNLLRVIEELQAAYAIQKGIQKLQIGGSNTTIVQNIVNQSFHSSQVSNTSNTFNNVSNTSSTVSLPGPNSSMSSAPPKAHPNSMSVAPALPSHIASQGNVPAISVSTAPPTPLQPPAKVMSQPSYNHSLVGSLSTAQLPNVGNPLTQFPAGIMPQTQPSYTHSFGVPTPLSSSMLGTPALSQQYIGMPITQFHNVGMPAVQSHYVALTPTAPYATVTPAPQFSNMIVVGAPIPNYQSPVLAQWQIVQNRLVSEMRNIGYQLGTSAVDILLLNSVQGAQNIPEFKIWANAAYNRHANQLTLELKNAILQL